MLPASRTVASSTEYAIASDADIVRVRQAVRSLAIQAGLSIVDQTKLVTAASELARNALVHGGGGTARLEAVHDGVRGGVSAVFADSGPGIADMERVLSGGYTTGGGMGLGLSGSRRLVDEFRIDSTVGRGTTVTVLKWKR